MNTGDRIGGWLLGAQLGRGEAGSTWLARRALPGEGDAEAEAVLKILEVGEARNWTGFDLFEREVDALKGLSHPGIPRFMESFEDSGAGDTRLVLVMELMPGVDLAKTVAAGRRFSEAEVKEILAGLADILAYLGSLRPPVVHRDVNPHNVLLDEGGRVSLVDFSGARDALLRAVQHGATMIGTAGYIPLEQVSGKATSRSDLYGAAATALFLLTRANPSDLPLVDLKPDLAALPAIGKSLARILDSWLEADESKRSIEPAGAARMLRAGESETAAIQVATASADRTPHHLPSDSRVKISENGDSLRIVIPPGNFSNLGALTIGGFSLFWLAFVAFWTFSAIAMGAPIFFVLFSIPFWAVGIGMVRATILSLFTRTELLLDVAAGLCLTEGILGSGKKRRWPPSDLGKCSIENAVFSAQGNVPGSAQKELVIEAGAKMLRIGKTLSERELSAIAEKIEAWRLDRSGWAQGR
jgi:serine/threonine protein kinase